MPIEDSYPGSGGWQALTVEHSDDGIRGSERVIERTVSTQPLGDLCSRLGPPFLDGPDKVKHYCCPDTVRTFGM